jgi:FtsZ-binding cell division protein ZapB
MTNEILEKLTRVIKDSNQTIKSPELSAVSETQELNSTLEINPQRSETNQSHLRTNNHS